MRHVMHRGRYQRLCRIAGRRKTDQSSLILRDRINRCCNEPIGVIIIFKLSTCVSANTKVVQSDPDIPLRILEDESDW